MLYNLIKPAKSFKKKKKSQFRERAKAQLLMEKKTINFLLIIHYKSSKLSKSRMTEVH